MRSKLSDHKFEKGVFITPMNQISDFEFQSWINDKLPAYFWLALIINYYGKNTGLKKAYNIISYLTTTLKEEIESPTFNTINNIEKHKLVLFYDYLVTQIDREALYPLTIIYYDEEYLIFNKYFNINSEYERLEILIDVLHETYNHQSNLSTDVRFIIVWFHVLYGRLKFLEGMKIIDALNEYANLPYEADEMGGYSSLIRATELPLIEIVKESFDEVFNNNFWDNISQLTECNLIYVDLKDEDNMEEIKQYQDYLYEIVKYYKDYLETIDILNVKSKVLISIFAYSYKRLNELVEYNLYNQISGRTITRSLVENLIMM